MALAVAVGHDGSDPHHRPGRCGALADRQSRCGALADRPGRSGALADRPPSGGARPVLERVGTRRIAVGLAVSALVLVLAALGLLGPVPSPPRPSEEAAVAGSVYVVRPGDTLWSIAARLTPRGEDVRPVVAELAATHGSSGVDVGDRLAVPRRR